MVGMISAPGLFYTPSKVPLVITLVNLGNLHQDDCSRPNNQSSFRVARPPTVFRVYTPKTLIEFNGEDNRPVYLAVRGRVFDVSPGRNFYGPGGPYENFAGRDASRGLAHQSFDEDMLTKDLSAPLDDLKNLDADQLENLKSWEERFLEKYLVVGKLVAEGDDEAPKS
ncbi:hypothetical protein N7493_004669 [Penicillium malachiteum]|uniref:Cytochrome b5 heme-binding domain-containing protein n=1 Tax=Penicillium malachiteum TaxID=1324776 RepID=A0AAD6MX74_9EURO|nr:hypothetical protein N7493_004669 [Penicillium malachiteum]